MSTKPDIITKAWSALAKVAMAREAATVREAELKKTRKFLEGRLDELGAGNTAEHKNVSREYVVTLRGIDFQRDRMKVLADDMERIIKAGLQNKFDFAEDEFDEQELVRVPTEAELFVHKPSGEGEKPEHEKPVGRLTEPEKEPQVAVGENQHLLARVIELDMRENLKGACIDANLGTVGSLYNAVVEDTTEDKSQLAARLNVDGAAARQIAAAVSAFLKKHTRAEMAVEGIGGIEPRDDRKTAGGRGAGRKRGKA